MVGKNVLVETLSAASLLLVGILLLIPGLVTDAIGLLLLIPAIRRSFVKATLKHFTSLNVKEPTFNPNEGTSGFVKVFLNGKNYFKDAKHDKKHHNDDVIDGELK